MPPLPLSSPSFSFSSFLPRPLLLLHLSKISRNMASRSNTKPRKKGPIRVIIRISSSGQRLTVPPDGLTLNSTLADVVSRVSLPSVSSNATMVCLRQVAPYNEWSGTTLKSMLDGDDGCAGILLTFDVTASKSAIDKTAASLNIKPEPMDISEDTTQQNAVQRHPSNAMSPAEAWSIVLSSNFDTASKSCLLTLLKIIDNILSRSDPKVRCIRYGNPNFQSKVASCRGALEFLYSLGFVPTYAVFGNMSEPESLELKNESRQVLLRGREVLILSAKKDFGIEDDDLPKLPMAPVVSTSAALTAPTAAAAANSSRTQEFNIYKGHSTNIAAQQAGAPDPYADKSLSTTERTLQNLEAKKRNMEKQLQSSVEMDRCLNAYLPGDGPITGSSAVAQESRGDSSLLAARMKRMEEERRKREEGGFTTKAMRDLEKMKKAKVSFSCVTIELCSVCSAMLILLTFTSMLLNLYQFRFILTLKYASTFQMEVTCMRVSCLLRRYLLCTMSFVRPSTQTSTLILSFT